MMRLGESATRAALQDALARDATRLIARERCPIDLTVVARRVGVHLRFDPEAPAYGQLRRNRSGPEIVVRARDADDVRARFSAAHEIAHYLLELYGAPRPAGRREYWQLERMCHGFARSPAYPRDRHGLGSRSEPRAFRRVARTSSPDRSASPSIAGGCVASSRRRLGGVSFAEIGFARASRSDLTGVITWIIERFPWLGRGARSHITTDHFLAPLMRKLGRETVGMAGAADCNGRTAAAERRPRGCGSFAATRRLAVPRCACTSTSRSVTGHVRGDHAAISPVCRAANSPPQPARCEIAAPEIL